jgi:hypothetical protein
MPKPNAAEHVVPDELSPDSIIEGSLNNPGVAQGIVFPTTEQAKKILSQEIPRETRILLGDMACTEIDTEIDNIQSVMDELSQRQNTLRRARSAILSAAGTCYYPGYPGKLDKTKPWN